MTRRKSTGRAEKEARLQAALTAVQSGDKNASEAIHDFSVSCQRFYSRLNGRLPQHLVYEAEQLLSYVQEKELVRWITELTKTGYSPYHATILEMAQIICVKSDPLTLEHTQNLVNIIKIGDQWIQRFIRRYPELSTVRLRRMDMNRVKNASFERLSKWFEGSSIRHAGISYFAGKSVQHG